MADGHWHTVALTITGVVGHLTVDGFDGGSVESPSTHGILNIIDGPVLGVGFRGHIAAVAVNLFSNDVLADAYAALPSAVAT